MDENSQNQPEGQKPAAVQPPKTSGMAITSLVLGILGLFGCIFAIPGLILGIIAGNQINRQPDKLTGQSLARAGRTLSVVGLVIGFCLVLLLYPVFTKARLAAQQHNCLANLRILSASIQMYVQDWDDCYPLAASWNEALTPYAKKQKPPEATERWNPLVCPAIGGSVPAYAMNGKLTGRNVRDLVPPADIVITIFESIHGRNMAGGQDLLPFPSRHVDGNSVGFADGHVKLVPEEVQQYLNFDPAVQNVRPVPRGDQ